MLLEDARHLLGPAEPIRARLVVHETAESSSQLDVVLQISLECLAYRPGTHDQDVARAGPSLDALQIMALHGVTQGDQADQAEEQGAAKCHSRDRFFLGQNHHHDRKHR